MPSFPGFKVPSARICLTMLPRVTVSIQTAWRSTTGEAWECVGEAVLEEADVAEAAAEGRGLGVPLAEGMTSHVIVPISSSGNIRNGHCRNGEGARSGSRIMSILLS